MGVTVHEVPVQLRGFQTAILLALRPCSHSTHPAQCHGDSLWGPSRARPAQREGPACTLGSGRPGRKSCVHPEALQAPASSVPGTAHRTIRYSGMWLNTRAGDSDSSCLLVGKAGLGEPRCWCWEPGCPVWSPCPRGAGRGTRSFALRGGSLPGPEAEPRPPLHPSPPPPPRRPHFTGTALPSLRLLCAHRAGRDGLLEADPSTWAGGTAWPCRGHMEAGSRGWRVMGRGPGGVTVTRLQVGQRSPGLERRVA